MRRFHAPAAVCAAIYSAGMADDMPPEDLVTARRAFLAADAELGGLARLAPKPVIDHGVVSTDAELNAVRGEMQRLALFISGHDWITSSGNRYGAWQRVDQAAKAAE